VFWFLLINAFVSAFLNYAYIMFMPGIDTTLSRVYVHVALVAHTASVYLVLGLVFSAVALASGRVWVTSALMVLTLSAMHMLNILDIIVFRIFRYHLNSMVVTLVFTEGARDSLHIGWKTVLTYAAASSVIVGFEIWLTLTCMRKLAQRPRSVRFMTACLILAVASVAADKTAYALADLYNVRDVTRFTRVFPLYQRTTVKHFARKYLGVKTDPSDTVTIRGRGKTLAYPLEPLERARREHLPNIVWIVIDAWRFDMLNEEVTPNILAFSRRATVFSNHLSGGNATRFGIFTLFYGVYGTYWHSFLSENQSPVFLDELARLGYDFRIISSSSLSNPEFRRTAFVKLAPYITDDLPGSMADTRDPALAETFISWLEKRDTTRPFFGFLFFDAPHGPYIFPKDFEKFKPSTRSPNYVTSGRKDARALFNSYKNAVFFDDHLTGKVLSALERHGLLKDTIVLITGDHGEEFFETGYWGHTSTFSRYQAHVSCVLYIPGRGQETIRHPTSHLDVVPTFMKILGYTTSPRMFSNGGDMFGHTRDAYRVVSGWDEAALVYDDMTIVMPTQSYLAGTSQVRRNADYAFVADERTQLRRRQGDIVSVIRSMSAFLR